MDYTDINSRTIDKWVDEGWEWARPISHEEYIKALEGNGKIFLTPTKPVPTTWLGDMKERKVLALASGGGQQGPVLHAMKAEVTVFDNSERMLDMDWIVSEREEYEALLVKGDMTKPLPFPDEAFDMIINPVSNCYIEHPEDVWKECFRILKCGGRLLAGLDNGINYIVDENEMMITSSLPYNPLRNPDQMKTMNPDDGIQFSHSYEENIQGMIDAGFTIRGIYSDTNGRGRLHELNIPTFYAIFAEKR